MATYSIFELEPIFIDFKNESYNLGLDIQANQNDTLTLNFICRNNGIEEDMTKYKVELRVHNNNSNTDYIQTQNENVTLGTDGSVKIVCQSLKGNKLTAYSGQLNGVLRIFNTENKQKATRIITMRIVADPLETDRANICESTITKLEDLDWILNEAYNIEDEFKKAIEEAIKQKAELVAKISESVTAKNNLNSTIQTANNTNNTLNATNTTAINTKNELNTLNTTANNTKSNLDKSNVTALGTNKTLSDTNTTAINTNNTLNTTINNANNSKTALDTSKNNADKSKSALDGSVSTGNTLKTNLDGSIATGTTLKNDIDNRITTGNKLKTDMDNSSTIATSKKEILDSANVQAEKNIETLNSFGDASQLTKDVTTLKTKVLENTLTSIETDSTLTKLDNCENGFVRNMQIMGRTLQNICKTKGGTIKPNGSLALGLTYMFKQNTIYTLIVNSKVNSLDGTIKIVLETPNIYPGVIVNKGEIGLKTFKFQTPNIQTGMSIYTDSSTIGECILDDIMILEGDYTNKEIPSYFEGIKSVGEVEGNKISILTKGKNLAPVNSGEFSVDKSNTSNWYFINGSGGAYGDMSNNKTKFYLPSGNYTFKGNCNGFVQLTEQNEREIINNGTSKELKAGYYIIRFRNSNGVEKINFDKIQITLANYDAEYESYKEDKTEILLDTEPLRGLSNGVGDIVNFDKSERTKNVVKAVLNGSENGWVKFDTDGIQGFKLVNSNISQDNFMCLSDNITALEQRIWYKSNETSIAISYGAIYLKFKGITEINDMKAKLKANPTTVYYQLANPVTEKLNIKDTLQTFTDGYIMLDNAITPCTQLEYSTNIPSAIGGLTEITDKLVDDVTNVEITISDMDAEIGEARKDKNTLNERLEDDKTNILNTIGQVDIIKDGDIASQLKEKANLKDVKIISSLSDIGLSANDMTTDFSNNVLKIIKAIGANRRISLYPYQTESNTNLYNSVKAWCGFNTDAYQLYIDTSFNGAENLPNKIEVIPNYNDGNNKIFIGFFDNQLGNCREVATTESFEIKLLNGASVYLTDSNYSPYFIRVGQLATITGNIKVSGISDDTVIMRLPQPKGHKWIRAFTNNGKPISFYLSPSGELKIRGASGVDEGDNLPLDFSYRI